MGSYNNDSFKKIKKIFYIIAIISMLLSIKSKVFAVDYEIEDYNATIQIPDFFYDYKFVISTRYIYNKYDFEIALLPTDTQAKFYYQDSGVKIDSSSQVYSKQFNGNSAFSSIASINNYLNNLTLQNLTLSTYNANVYVATWTRSSHIITNSTIYSSLAGISDNDILLNPNTSNFISPFFDNVTEIENGNPDGVFISAGSLADTDNLYFHLLEIHTGISAPDNSVYYYSDKTFLLNKDTSYYSTYQNSNEFYYYIPRYKLGLSQNTSYLYVLNNSSSQIQNSNGIYEKDVANGIYDVLESDTAGVISATEEQSDIMRNMEQQAIENSNSINNINNNLNDTNVSSSTENEINANLNFNNQNSTLNNLNSGFFSRLTTMISNLIPYNLNEDTTINIPYPNSNKNLTLHSNIISSNLSNTLILIINSFWIYIFSFYLFKFINKIYIAVTTGNILDTFNSNDEAITNNML